MCRWLPISLTSSCTGASPPRLKPGAPAPSYGWWEGHVEEIRQDTFVAIATCAFDLEDPDKKGETLWLEFENHALCSEELEQLTPYQIFRLSVYEAHEDGPELASWEFPRWEPGEYESARAHAESFAEEMMQIFGPNPFGASD